MNDDLDACRPQGLRARKQRETRHRIAEAGFELFLANGFEATTLDAIATAAGISRRTIFHYFDSKDAILFAWEQEIEEGMRAAVSTRPDHEPILDSVQAIIASLVDRFETARAIAIDRLMRSTETLRARKQAIYERQERDLYAALVQRWPDTTQSSKLRIAAMAGIGALRIAAEHWRRDGGKKSLRIYVDDAFNRMRDCLNKD